MPNLVVVSDTIPGWTPPASQPYVQIDAPSGYCIVAIYGDNGPAGLNWAAGGLDAGCGVVVDGDGLITGVIFTNGEYGDAYTGYIQCAPIAQPDPLTSGRQALTAGVATVSSSAVTANSRIMLQRQAAGGVTAGNSYEVTARTAGTSFTITAVILATGATGILDTSTIDWVIVEP